MTIFIGKKKVTEKVATRFISELDGFVEKIVGAWRDSNIAHHFEDEKSFKKGVCKNLTTLSSPETIRTLFRPRNYLFSTQKEEEDRRETLYFKNCAMKKTGRLRQQHPKGPLAKIDKKAKTHVFLSKRRFEDLKKWHKNIRDAFRISNLPKNDERLTNTTSNLRTMGRKYRVGMNLAER